MIPYYVNNGVDYAIVNPVKVSSWINGCVKSVLFVQHLRTQTQRVSHCFGQFNALLDMFLCIQSYLNSDLKV